MSAQRGVTIAIYNVNNPYPLTFGTPTGVEGTFDPAFPATIAANNSEPVTAYLGNDSILHGADAIITFTSGTDNSTTFTLTVSNSQDQASYPNLANLSISSSGGASQALYGTSYLYAGICGTPKSRDYPPPTGVSLCIDVYIVLNNGAVSKSPFLNGINKVVFLMLENRSLDHLLGQLYTESNPADKYYPPDSQSTPYLGLGDSPSFANQVVVGGTIHTTTAYAITPSDTPTTPDPDPGEKFAYVQDQLFGPGGTASLPAPMTGFLTDYFNNSGLTNDGDGYPDCNQVMGFYTSAQLPVISGLAAHYAISDQWFCSVPSQTYVNRAFSVAGTSSGYVDNSDNPNPPGYQMRTMFNVLLDCGITDWQIVTQDRLYNASNSFLSFEFEQIDSNIQDNYTTSFDDFLNQCANDSLPAFTYIEPAWYAGSLLDWNGNDYHPTANLLPGETTLYQIYQALAASESWNETLFIVTFDEHGGTMDHISPLSCTPPDAMTYTPSEGAAFGFDYLGVRVPTLFISPQVSQGTVLRAIAFEPPPQQYHAFDHTSFIRVILGWLGVDVSMGVMGARAATAPDFSPVLSGGIVVNPGSITITPYAQSDEAKKRSQNAPLNDLQRRLTYALAYSISGSKKGSDEHHRIWNEMKALKTLKELRSYAESKKSELAARKGQ